MTPLAPHFDFSRLTAARLRRRAGVVLGLGRYRRTLSAMASSTALFFPIFAGSHQPDFLLDLIRRVVGLFLFPDQLRKPGQVQAGGLGERIAEPPRVGRIIERG
jgi:hypothetical protein